VIALIDGDILTYRIGFAYNDEGFALARHMLGETIQTICEELETEDFELFITGSTNFRNDYAVTEPYKGNRKGDRACTLRCTARLYARDRCCTG
jgi:hypothetical protein